MTPHGNGAHEPLGSSGTSYVIEVTSKHGIGDAGGAAVMGQIHTLGVPGIREVRVSWLYEIHGRLTLAQAHQLARDLLADPVTQEYRLDSATPSPAFLVGPHWRMEVWLKSSVTDPVGESVRQAIADMGLPKPQQVRTGTAYQILGRVLRPQAETILNKLLSNSIIHRTHMDQH